MNWAPGTDFHFTARNVNWWNWWECGEDLLQRVLGTRAHRVQKTCQRDRKWTGYWKFVLVEKRNDGTIHQLWIYLKVSIFARHNLILYKLTKSSGLELATEENLHTHGTCHLCQHAVPREDDITNRSWTLSCSLLMGTRKKKPCARDGDYSVKAQVDLILRQRRLCDYHGFAGEDMSWCCWVWLQQCPCYGLIGLESSPNWFWILPKGLHSTRHETAKFWGLRKAIFKKTNWQERERKVE